MRFPRLPSPFARQPAPAPTAPPTIEQAATNLTARLVALGLTPILERAVGRLIGKVGSLIAQRIITAVAVRVAHPIIQRIVVTQVDRLATHFVTIAKARIEARKALNR